MFPPTATKHYDKGKEIRTLGVGHYAFSQDEEERARQQAELKQMRNQTVVQRQSAERIKDARKEKIEERRRMLKERAAKRRKVYAEDAVSVKAEIGDAVDDGTELDDDVSLLFKDVRKRVERNE